jgi:Tfp pilus assembly protein FimT
MPPTPLRPPRAGTTLIELLTLLLILAVLTSIAVPPFVAVSDRIAVRAATQATVATFAQGRRGGLHLGRATVEIHATGVRLLLRDSVAAQHDFASRYGVSVRSSTPAMTFDHAGLGRGVANGTIILARRQAADTVVVSRLGRVRH